MFASVVTIWVAHRGDLLVVVQVVEKRSEDSPACVKLVVTNKVGVVALECVQNQRLVGLWDLQVGETTAVGQVELGNNSLHAETWQLRVHLDVNTLVGLHSDDQLVAGNVLEDARSDVLELNANLGLLLVQSLTSLEDERNTVPSLVLDVCDHRGESWASGVLWHCVVVLVAWLAAVQRLLVLANNDVLGLDCGHSSKNSDLLVTDILGGEGDGALHGEQSKDLQQIWTRC